MANQNRDVDYEITRLLQQNGRIPNTEIAKKLNVSEATVRNRLQKLLKEKQMQVVARLISSDLLGADQILHTLSKNPGMMIHIIFCC